MPRNIVFLPIALIRQAQDGGWLRSVAYLVRLKALYKNNTHYLFYLRSLADRLHCSPATLGHHLRILEQQGTVRYHGRNITFLGLRPLCLLFGYQTIGVPVDPQNQLEMLRAQIIRANLNAQSYKMHRSGIQKRLSGSIPMSFTEKAGSSYMGLSCYGIAGLFGLSKSSGHRIRKKLVRRRLLKQTRRFTLIRTDFTIKQFYLAKTDGTIPIYAIFRQGNVFQERRSELEYIGV